MKRLILIGLVTALVLSACVIPSGPLTDPVYTIAETADRAMAGVGFSIQNGKLVDANGNVFIFQGINHAHTWYKDKLSQVLPAIRTKNANSVRVVLSNGTRWTKDNLASVIEIIDVAKANQLISVLEVHDTTGYGEDGAATSLSLAADYWVEMKNALIGQEAYVIVNIGNEPFGNTTIAAWYDDTVNAIQKLRVAGIRNTIMVDAPNWGQDWQNEMRNRAASLFTQDPDRNIIFSVHMYQVYGTASSVTNYIQSFVSAGIPLVVGEFGFQHGGQPVAFEAVMSASKSMVNGYLGWSWSGNGGGVEYLDLVLNWNPAQPSSWGNILFADLTTAATCTIFQSTGNQNPSIYIEAPANDANIIQGTTIPFNVQAHDPDGSVSRVAFYDGSDLIAEDAGAPYSVNWTAPAVIGTRTLRAVVIDNDGLTASAEVTVNVQPEANSGEVTVEYSKNDWGSGFTGNVTLKNTGTQPIDNWMLTFTFPGNQTINHYWSGAFTQVGQSVQVLPLNWNVTIPPNGSVNFGFNAQYSGSNTDPTDMIVSY